MEQKKDIQTETAIRTALEGFFQKPPYNHPDALKFGTGFTRNPAYFTGDVQKGMSVMSSLLPGHKQRIADVKERLQQHVDEARANAGGAPFKFDILSGRPHFSQIEVKASPESWTAVQQVVFETYGTKPWTPAPAPSLPRDLISVLG